MTQLATVDRHSERNVDYVASIGAISADSHIVEPPNCYVDHIDPKMRDVAPHIVADPDKGDRYVIEGLVEQVPLNMAAVAGQDPATFGRSGVMFSDLNPG